MAVFLGSLPGSMSSAVGMRQEGRSQTYIISAWSTVAVAYTLATVLGYSLLSGLSPNLTSALLALATSWRCSQTQGSSTCRWDDTSVAIVKDDSNAVADIDSHAQDKDNCLALELGGATERCP